MGKKSRRNNKKKGRPKQQTANSAATLTAATENLSSLGLEDNNNNANNTEAARPVFMFDAAYGANAYAAAIAATTETFVGSDGSNGTQGCCHGCPSDQTNPKSLFFCILREWLQISIKKIRYDHMGLGTLASVEQAELKFHLKYEETIMDPESGFAQFLFAFSAHNYLSKGIPFANPENRIRHFQNMEQMPYIETARWGINLRYRILPKWAGEDLSLGSELDLKFRKYYRDLQLERGFINVLAREIPCSCLDASKARLSVCPSEKTGFCWGCGKEFPKHQLSYCKCRATVYCSRACQVDHWPQHKDLCKRFTSGRIDNPFVTTSCQDVYNQRWSI